MAKIIAASHAFRKYNWLKNVPVTNIAGDLRGMVVSANWRVAYNYTVKYGKVLEHYHIGSIASVAVGIAESYEQIDEIVRSNESWSVKGAKLSTQATAVAMNVLTGIVTGPAHAVLMSMQGYCNIADLVKGKPIGTYGQTLKALDVSIESAAKQVTDGKNIYLFVNTTITPKVGRMMGL